MKIDILHLNEELKGYFENRFANFDGTLDIIYHDLETVIVIANGKKIFINSVENFIIERCFQHEFVYIKKDGSWEPLKIRIYELGKVNDVI